MSSDHLWPEPSFVAKEKKKEASAEEQGYGQCACQQVGGTEQCPLPAYWRPRLRLHSPERSGFGFYGLPIGVCTVHKDLITIHDILTEELWLQVLSRMAASGLPRPDRSLTTMDWLSGYAARLPAEVRR